MKIGSDSRNENSNQLVSCGNVHSSLLNNKMFKENSWCSAESFLFEYYVAVQKNLNANKIKN